MSSHIKELRNPVTLWWKPLAYTAGMAISWFGGFRMLAPALISAPSTELVTLGFLTVAASVALTVTLGVMAINSVIRTRNKENEPPKPLDLGRPS